MLMAVSKNKFIVLLIKIFGAVSLPIVARTRLQTLSDAFQLADLQTVADAISRANESVDRTRLSGRPICLMVICGQVMVNPPTARRHVLKLPEQTPTPLAHSPYAQRRRSYRRRGARNFFCRASPILIDGSRAVAGILVRGVGG